MVNHFFHCCAFYPFKTTICASFLSAVTSWRRRMRLILFGGISSSSSLSTCRRRFPVYWVLFSSLRRIMLFIAVKLFDGLLLKQYNILCVSLFGDCARWELLWGEIYTECLLDTRRGDVVWHLTGGRGERGGASPAWWTPENFRANFLTLVMKTWL